MASPIPDVEKAPLQQQQQPQEMHATHTTVVVGQVMPQQAVHGQVFNTPTVIYQMPNGQQQQQFATQQLPQYQPPAIATPWTTGLFDCMQDVRSTVDIMFCHYCQMGRQYNTMTYNMQTIEPWTCFGAWAIDACVGFHLGTFFLTWHLRQRLRYRYSIQGDDVKDCLASLFCPACTLCQHYREMSVRGEWPTACCIDAPFCLPAPPLQHMGEEEGEMEMEGEMQK